MEPQTEATPRLVLIGTGHVFRIEDTIQDAIRAVRPDKVFVELDQGRLQALLYRRRTGQNPPSKGGLIHGRLQKFQESVAGMYGAEVGGEMVAAFEAGQEIGARVLLIDAPADQTLKRALKQLSLRERLRALGMLAKAGFQQMLPKKRDSKEAMEQQLRDYQDDPGAVLEELREQFPTIHRVVIAERDARMASGIRHALLPGEVGLAVVGDGHVAGMEKLLEGIDLETYRLQAVRDGALPKPEAGVATGTAESVSFGFTLGDHNP